MLILSDSWTVGMGGTTKTGKSKMGTGRRKKGRNRRSVRGLVRRRERGYRGRDVAKWDPKEKIPEKLFQLGSLVGGQKWKETLHCPYQVTYF